jgi:glycosyltransferase involved in cell wall biosynthesis
MQRAGLDVMVACPQVRQSAQQDLAFVNRLKAAGVPVVIVPMRRSIDPLADLTAYRCLVKLIRQQEFDVVHAHSSKAGVLGRLAAWRTSRPLIVYTPNAFAFLGAQRGWTRWLYRAIERWLGHLATDALICVSPWELSLARQHAIVPPQRLVLVENVIDASRFAPRVDPAEAKSRFGLDPARIVVGSIGRLSWQKGPDYFVRAARLVIEAGWECQFVLVGEGELEGRLRGLVTEYRLGDHVVLAGYQEDIPQVLAALDIFVLSSLYEGLPYTLMEAMAAGRPVVATRGGPNGDLVRDGENGLLVPPRDARALADALIRLLSAPDERKRLGERALAAAQARPTPEGRVRQVVDLYSRLLESKRGETHE